MQVLKCFFPMVVYTRKFAIIWCSQICRNKKQNGSCLNNSTTHLVGKQQFISSILECDATYFSKWKPFKRYVDGHSTLSASLYFLLHKNVNNYFASVVAKYTGILNTIKRVIYVLEWFFKNREQGGHNFIVKCCTVNFF